MLLTARKQPYLHIIGGVVNMDITKTSKFEYNVQNNLNKGRYNHL